MHKSLSFLIDGICCGNIHTRLQTNSRASPTSQPIHISVTSQTLFNIKIDDDGNPTKLLLYDPGSRLHWPTSGIRNQARHDAPKPGHRTDNVHHSADKLSTNASIDFVSSSSSFDVAFSRACSSSATLASSTICSLTISASALASATFSSWIAPSSLGTS